jgi:hypothetical protein
MLMLSMGMNNAFGHFIGAGCWVPNNMLVLAEMKNMLVVTRNTTDKTVTGKRSIK